MSIRTDTEEVFRLRLTSKLNSSQPYAWLDPAKYDNPILFDNSPVDPVKTARIPYPIHSYEIFEMQEQEIDTLQDKMIKKIESYFISKISEAESGSRVIYSGGDLKISLEYRIAIITLQYNLVIFSPAS